TTGTYTILITPNSTYTGSVTLTLSDVTDAVSTISANGTPVTISTTTTGQNAKLTFSGTAGQRVSLKVTSTVFNLTVSISKPSGVILASQGFAGRNVYFFEPMTLPLTGTYSIYIAPGPSYPGNPPCTLYNMPADLSGTITAGTPYAATIST